jgi:hypothetical protein
MSTSNTQRLEKDKDTQLPSKHDNPKDGDTAFSTVLCLTAQQLLLAYLLSCCQMEG